VLFSPFQINTNWCQAKRQKSFLLKNFLSKAALPNRKLLDPRKMVLSTSKKAAASLGCSFFADLALLDTR
jgi:hypothetical protein